MCKYCKETSCIDSVEYNVENLSDGKIDFKKEEA